ncbi:MAG: N-methyl-L-tryptophan oxidase [Trueperaceae bacterium]|nr:N-methyl-L-tryptophan oxidase [Trueperaceae bacterium]
MSTSHLIIVGAGLAGSFTALALAERGVRVTLLEARSCGHDRGSSHGGSRIFRHAYPETDYVRLAVRADEGWRALERDSGERLVWRSGGLDLETRGGSELPRIEEALRAHGRPHRRMDAAEVRQRFPAFAPASDVEAIHQPDAGVVAADRALLAALRRAADLGAELRFETPLAGLEPDAGGIVAATASGERIAADGAIVAAGPWLAEGPLAVDVPLWIEQQQVLYLGAPAGPDHGAETMPVFIDRDTDTYGMGRLEHPAAVKVSDHSGAPRIRLAERADASDATRAERTVQRVRRLLPGVGPMLSASLCLYTKSPDSDFVIGAHPSVPSAWVAGGFSGHGFKFGPALGAMMADLALEGSSPWWTPRFAVDRFSRGAPAPGAATTA